MSAHIELNERERQLLRLVALGYSNVQIAERTGNLLSTTTQNIYRLRTKLYLDSRAQMVVYAITTGVVAADELRHPYALQEEGGA